MTTTPQATIPLFQRLDIESQSNCNRSCWFCPRTYDRSGTYLDPEGRSVVKQMPTAKILDLLDQAEALGFRGGVAFYHYSEPLLDSRNVMLAREARARGLRPYLHTNGDVLRRDAALREAVQEVYERIVVGLYDYQTNEELVEAKRYWQGRLDGTKLEFSTIGRSGGLSADSMAIPRALVPSDPRMVVPDLTFPNAPCHRPLIRMIVRYDGTVCNCCEDTQGAFALGNVYESSLAELWFSDHHIQIVQDLIAGQREQYAPCRDCPLPPTGPPAAGSAIDILPRRYRADRAAPASVHQSG
jgi:2-deoxy-scyllo-inosamine dehydrogenase (SAM-dependent)/8-amino-3,8-dideoxy-alpha-D-manno-octulosonate transaminase